MVRTLTVFVFLAASCLSYAQQSESVIEELREAPSFFALPTELDHDFGAVNGDATIIRLMPLYGFTLGENWRLVNLTIITLADAPGGTPTFPGGDDFGGNTAGIADLLHASFFTPKSSGSFIWGIGPMLSLPTATDDALGSDKWSLGPAVRLTHTTTHWSFGVVAGQRWSVAGSGNRPDVNQLLIRGVIRRELGEKWYFVSNPLITSNWDAPGETWLVPVGGGLGRKFEMNGHPWAWSLQGYYNAIKPDGAPDWVARFSITAAIPMGGKSTSQ